MKTLILYATRHGATRGVAETILSHFNQSGHPADLHPIGEAPDLSSYDLIIAGSAIQAASWLPEAREFITANKEILQRKKFAAFAVCMTLAMKNASSYRKGIENWMSPVCEKVPPLSLGIFAGKLELKQIESFSDRLKFWISIRMGVWKEGDHRDWNAIREWAEEVKQLAVGGKA